MNVYRFKHSPVANSERGLSAETPWLQFHKPRTGLLDTGTLLLLSVQPTDARRELAYHAALRLTRADRLLHSYTELVWLPFIC